MADLGSLVVSLAANTAEFSDDLGRAAHIADKNMKSIADAATKAGIALQAMAVGAGAAMLGFGKAALDAADSTLKAAQATGLTTEAYSELAYAASLADVSSEEFAASMVKLNKSATEAAKGSTDAKLAYQALGISIRDSNGNLKNGEQLLDEIADKFAGFEDGPNKSALALDLFGKAGARMVPLLNEGSAGLREAREEAKAFGLSIGTEAAERAERFNDNLTRLNAIQKGFSQEMAAAVVGPLTDYEEALIKVAKESDLFSTAGKAGTVVLQTLSVLAANAAYVFKAVGTEIGGLVAQLAAAGRGDFKGFVAIREQMQADAVAARKSLDDFEKSIMSIGEAAAKADEKSAGKKAAAPDLGALAAQQKLNQMLFDLQVQQGEDMYKVELDSYDQLQKLRQDSAHEDAVWAQKKVDEVFASGQDLYAAELESYDSLEHLRADARNADIEERRRYAAEGLDQIRQEYSSEVELQGDHYADQLSRLIEARELGLVTEQQYADKYAEIAQANADRVAQIASGSNLDIEKFRKLSFQRQITNAADFFASMTEATARGNKTMFEINKIASLSSAVLKGYQAVIDSYQIGAEIGGPVVGAAFAAVATAATGAMIAQIASTQFGSGSTPSINGGAPATPVSQAQTAQGQAGGQTTVVQIVGGDTFSRKQVRDLMDRIVQEQRNGSKVVLA